MKYNYYIDQEYTGSIVFKDIRNNNSYTVPRQLIDQLKYQAKKGVEND